MRCNTSPSELGVRTSSLFGPRRCNTHTKLLWLITEFDGRLSHCTLTKGKSWTQTAHNSTVIGIHMQPCYCQMTGWLVYGDCALFFLLLSRVVSCTSPAPLSLWLQRFTGVIVASVTHYKQHFWRKSRDCAKCGTNGFCNTVRLSSVQPHKHDPKSSRQLKFCFHPA